MALLDASTLLVLVFTLFVILLVKKLLQLLTGPKVPPGPMPLPIIGNILQMPQPDVMHLKYSDLAKKYGDVFTLNIFTTKFIFLNTHEVIKEVFIKNADSFSHRPLTYTIRLFSDNAKGLVWQSGQKWNTLRKFMISSLRDFGVGKKSMEGQILQEAAALTNVFIEYGGKPFNPAQIVTEAVSNVICSVCFGTRFEYTDKQFRSLIDKIVDNFTKDVFMEPADFIPILQYFPLSTKLKEFIGNAKDIDNFIKSQIEEHRETFDKNYLRDFIDLYLETEALGKDNMDDEHLSEANIRGIISDLFIAGTDTTATSILWAMVYMLNYPDIQTRLGKEMEQVVGKERQPTLADKTHLNYLQAFIMETLRLSCNGFVTLPHLCTADTQIGGYTIPKGATVLANIYHVHMSEKYWKNPTQFNPDRFLDSNGKMMNIKEGFIAFGTGPRQCPGDSFARTNLFLILACLIQRFTIKPEVDNNLPPLLGKAGFILKPQQFNILAIPK